MTDEQLKQVRELVAALSLIPADVKDDWGEYPSHDEAAEKIGIYMNGSRVSKFGSVRLGMLAGCAPALSAILAERDAMKAENDRVREALVFYEHNATLCRKITPDGDAGRKALNDDGGGRAARALVALRVLEPKEAKRES